MLVEKQASKTIRLAQFELGVHLDRIKGANLHADLTAHANGDVDVEHQRLNLCLADIVRLLVLVFLDVDALRGAFLLANLAGHAAEPRHRLLAVEHKEGEVAIVFFGRNPLFGILDGGQILLVPIASDEVFRRLRHSFDDSRAEHESIRRSLRDLRLKCSGLRVSGFYRSTSPKTISTLPRMTTTSATECPRHMSSKIVRLMRLGGLTR